MKTLHCPQRHKTTTLAILGFGLIVALTDPAQACSTAPYLGEVCVFAGNTCPTNYVIADGSVLPISQNEGLSMVLTNTYGGDGLTTFGLPDLRGRSVIGTNSPAENGLPSAPLGQAVGASSVVLSQSNLPLHAHAVNSLTPTTSPGIGAYLPVQTDATVRTPTLFATQSAFLTNATAGSGSSALKGLYTTTAPNPNAMARIPVTVQTTIESVSGTAEPRYPTPPFPLSTQSPAVALTYCIAVTGAMPPTTAPPP